MNATLTLGRSASASAPASWRNIACRLLLAGVFAFTCALVTACGGSADAPPPPSPAGPPVPPPVLPVPPTITQQPASLTVLVGQGASFTVAATGTAPLAYQWQRNGVDIAGATTTVYSVAASVLADSGAAFRAVVTNLAGSATSNAAILTVTVAAPVLTITPQPADASVVAGTTAAFTVGGTCSSGALNIQWQRSANAGASWADIAGAKASTYSLATVIGDSGAQFRAQLDCGGQSGAPSNAARLTVTAPGSVVLSLLPIVGLRDQAEIPSLTGIDVDPVGSPTAGSYTFITGNRIKRLSADLATITLVAGGPFSGSVDGVAGAAAFNLPLGLTQDVAGNVYVADANNHTIRRIAADGTVTTLAGLAGTQGVADGTGAAARFSQPAGIALGPDGDLYVSELENHLIRRVTTAGVVTTYAGSTPGYADGAALSAKFNSPRAVAVAANGDVLVADYSNARIRRILRAGNAAGAVQTLAGNGTIAAGSPDGIGTAAVIGGPIGMVVRGNTLTVRDYLGLLRQIDLTSTAVTTLTGSRTLGEGQADGSNVTARLRSGYGVTNAPNGGFMIADDIGLRLVSAAGAVRTIANGFGATPQGVGTLAQIPFGLGVNSIQGVTVDPAGNVVIADADRRMVRRISPAGVVTLAGGLVSGLSNSVDGVASEAQFTRVGRIVTDPVGVLFAIDNFSVRKIGVDNTVTLLAGSPTQFGAVDGNAATARFQGNVFNNRTGLAFGPGGNIFMGDAGNSAVRRIDPAGNVTTVAGALGQSGIADGPIATARFRLPGGMTFTPDGALYVIDGVNTGQTGILRRIAPDGASVSTLPVPLVSGFTGSIASDAAGTLYYGTTQGLTVLPLGGVPSLLIPQGPAVVLGASPQLMNVEGIAILGPKQLVILSGGQILIATLP